MLYLGIDQHARQITISLRDDSGDVLQGQGAWPAIGVSFRMTLDQQLLDAIALPELRVDLTGSNRG